MIELGITNWVTNMANSWSCQWARVTAPDEGPEYHGPPMQQYPDRSCPWCLRRHPATLITITPGSPSGFQYPGRILHEQLHQDQKEPRMIKKRVIRPSSHPALRRASAKTSFQRPLGKRNPVRKDAWSSVSKTSKRTNKLATRSPKLRRMDAAIK